MDRYISSKTLQDKQGTRYVSTTLFPTIKPSAEDVYIQITSTERLDLLANQFYDDVTAWPVIAAANKIKKGTLYIQPGTILRIPPKQTFTDLIFNLNNNR